MGYNSVTKQNYLDILKTFLCGLIFLFIGAIVGIEFIPPQIRQYINIAFFIIVLFSMFSGKGGFIKTKVSMYVYSVILGILTGSTYIYYFNILGANTFFTIVIGVIVIFMISYLIAASSSEEKIFRLGPVVFIGIVSLLIIEFINIFFFDFGTVDIIISSLGIAIYSIYAVIVMKSIQVRCRYGRLSEFEVVSLAYSIFISFLNLLLDLLRLVAIIKDDN